MLTFVLYVMIPFSNCFTIENSFHKGFFFYCYYLCLHWKQCFAHVPAMSFTFAFYIYLIPAICTFHLLFIYWPVHLYTLNLSTCLLLFLSLHSLFVTYFDWCLILQPLVMLWMNGFLCYFVALYSEAWVAPWLRTRQLGNVNFTILHLLVFSLQAIYFTNMTQYLRLKKV